MKNMTTVQMGKPLVRKLEKLKIKYNVKSYKDVVSKLVEKDENVPESLLGAFPNLGKFKREKDDPNREF